MSNNFEDDLLSELLGEVSKTFEIVQKKNYDYVALDSGFDKSTEDMVKEFRKMASGREEDASSASKSGNFDMQKLTRPLVFHLRNPKGISKAEVEALRLLKERAKDGFNSFFIFPSLESLDGFDGRTGRDLRSVLKLSGIVPSSAADPEIAEALCRAMKELFEIQMKIPAKFTGGSVRAPGAVHGQCYSGVLDMEGGGVSLSVITTSEAGMLAPALSKMTGADPSKLTKEQIENTACEFVNIIAGAARGRLNAAGYALRSPGLPKLIPPSGQGTLAAPDGCVPIEIQIETEIGKTWLEIRFYN